MKIFREGDVVVYTGATQIYREGRITECGALGVVLRQDKVSVAVRFDEEDIAYPYHVGSNDIEVIDHIEPNPLRKSYEHPCVPCEAKLFPMHKEGYWKDGYSYNIRYGEHGEVIIVRKCLHCGHDSRSSDIANIGYLE